MIWTVGEFSTTYIISYIFNAYFLVTEKIGQHILSKLGNFWHKDLCSLTNKNRKILGLLNRRTNKPVTENDVWFNHGRISIENKHLGSFVYLSYI